MIECEVYKFKAHEKYQLSNCSDLIASHCTNFNKSVFGFKCLD